ncbi:MAG TPA: hypothetical protein VGI93_05415 [Steroidobacteraceae bacterium]|jgi:hypothetical protein
MRRFILRILIFSVPFLVLGTFVAAVDPFDCLGISTLVADSVKRESAMPLHNPLWKLQKYKNKPVSRIILGDSSVALLNTDEIRGATGHQYFNFAYGGGTLPEAVDTYWFAKSKGRLDAVYIGIGLINFNAYQNLNRVPEAEAMLSNPLKYLTNRIVVGAAFLSAYSAWTHHKVAIGVPNVSHEAFWRQQIDESLSQLLHEYQYPAESARKLQEVAADCRRNATHLVIVIPPTHMELQSKIVALGRGADVDRFKEFVANLGTVYDMDYSNDFTKGRGNFSDPFHTMTDEVMVAEVWGNRQQYSRHLAPRN